MIENYPIELNLNPGNMIALKAFLGLMMFVLAQDIDFKAFKKNATGPRPLILGVIGQLFLLPLMTYLLLSLVDLPPQIALGFIIVAACPGGNMSNLFSFMAKNNLALSISLTVASTLLCLFFTPFNILFWGGLQESTSKLMSEVSLSYLDTLVTLMLIIVFPLILGGVTKKYFPKISGICVNVFRKISLLLLCAFFIIIIKKNGAQFFLYTGKILPYVIAHNFIAILIGFTLGRGGKLGTRDTRTLMVEIAIQNSGLGLGLVFTFFPNMIGAALVLAYWGVWHVVTGVGMVYVWKFIDRNKISETPLNPKIA